jgi:hypothetical protein
VYTFDGTTFRSRPLARIGELLEQDLEALGRVGMAERRVQLRERRVTQDVDGRTLLGGLCGDPVCLGVHPQLPYEGGRLRPVRGLIFEGR